MCFSSHSSSPRLSGNPWPVKKKTTDNTYVLSRGDGCLTGYDRLRKHTLPLLSLTEKQTLSHQTLSEHCTNGQVMTFSWTSWTVLMETSDKSWAAQWEGPSWTWHCFSLGFLVHWVEWVTRLVLRSSYTLTPSCLMTSHIIQDGRRVQRALAEHHL